ncbi:FAD/FMN-dependent dehydrogenase [Haloferax gibbonsii ATCC 33959]|uniref:FAD/FMN-dependent dehydrogenase n=1 Tax=Haloferax gibbonsii (strain ATCC 33959 / DSM 4427 / JCM 8863 / NBRC 102184 / NCIMB 2188 / Ma 2.38) TaxID=1227459 RepID=M0H9P5_HALGM|nr:FAD-binding oxidoreductase [Haloferax gibbonsii]ELZ81200.1 FAD/FMN-dependent dehydrogenase [Haloferax gibbonsii ATCC 33959]
MANDQQRDSFEASLRGPVLRPEDAEYDEARAVWNGMIDRRPSLIVRCAGVADVVRSVNYARENDLVVAVRGGGHNVAGTAVCDDGIVIDLSEMTSVRVDPDARTAWVGGGARWADVDHETQLFGLAAPGGVVSDTGVAGLTLGGGLGHLRRKHGLSCDNLRSVELVTAAGEVVTASRDENADLFWGLRGGGGNFGVVTGFEFELHPVGPDVAMCLVFYPAADIPDRLRDFREYARSAPDEVSALTFSGVLPDEELFGDAASVPKLGILGCYAGPPEEGTAALAPLREFADPIADFSGVMPYVELQRLLDEDYPDGMRYYWKSLYLDGLSDDVLERLDHWTAAAPSPLSTVDIWHLGGAIADVGADESSFAGRRAPYLLGVEGNWEDPDADEENVAWVRDCIDDMRRFSDGTVYLNFPGFLEGGDETMQTTFGPAYERLVDLKDEYDPANLFRLNQNVAPSASP